MLNRAPNNATIAMMNGAIIVKMISAPPITVTSDELTPKHCVIVN